MNKVLICLLVICVAASALPARQTNNRGKGQRRQGPKPKPIIKPAPATKYIDDEPETAPEAPAATRDNVESSLKPKTPVEPEPVVPEDDDEAEETPKALRIKPVSKTVRPIEPISADALAKILIDEKSIHEDGSFAYKYKTGNGIEAETSGELVKIDDKHTAMRESGSYHYPTKKGKTVTVTFVSDENGFRPTVTIE